MSMTRHCTPGMALYFVLVAICLFQVQAAVAEPRTDKPAFLSLSSTKLHEEYKDLATGKSLASNPYEFNDEIYYDGEFKSQEVFEKEYPFDVRKDGVNDRDNEYNGGHPYYSASTLPGIGSGSNKNLPYIACQSPMKFGRSHKFMYWEIVWKEAMKSKHGDIILVDLVNYEQAKGLTSETQANVIPSSTKKSLSFSPPTVMNTEKIIPPYKGIYSVHYKASNGKWAHSDIEYRQLSLEYHDDSKTGSGNGPHNVHYFHLSSWQNRQAVDPEKLQFLINEVDKKFTGQTIIVNCEFGGGRTGVFIEAREMYRATVKAKSTKWFFSSSDDPIQEYTKELRKKRSKMIDSFPQYEFLHIWAARMWAMTARDNINAKPGPAGNPSGQGRHPPKP
ncbi:tyrosine specific protein phosphatase [Aspergillus oryzae]|uniref:protein-tyrosine-phosphatase n=1 Tax=Aspergillus oryzae TaxID=5062 RepID=A0A1S9DEF4_ASPOZ|nr:tyrosine specific protein phosphatase [Aspergillus oryzae]